MCECAHIRRDKMKNTRTTQQTKIKKCMRWTASGLLLAVLFVLVFAGTLSGAFGIENSLQQSGIIENKVASAALIDTNTFNYNAANVTFAEASNWQNNVTPGTNTSHDWDDHFGSFFGSTVYDGCYTYCGTYDGEGSYSVATSYELSDLLSILTSGNTDTDYYKVNVSANVKLGARQSGSATLKQTVSAWIGTSATYDSSLHGSEYDHAQSSKNSTWTDNASISTNNFFTNPVGSSAKLYFGIYYNYKSNKNWAGAKTWELMMLESFTVTVERYKAYSGGSGSKDNPYILANRTDFDDFSRKITLGSTYSGKYFKVQPDASITGQNATTIAMGSDAITPIGNSSTKFAGTLQGNNCTINGLKVSGQYSGLFGYLNNATINDLTVNVTNLSDATSVAGIAGVVNGTTTINNCKVTGSVKGTHQVGGLVGFAQGCTLNITGCTNSATIETTNQDSDKSRTSAGGIVGYVNAAATVNITGTKNEGAVKASSGSANSGVGGIVGFSNGTVNIEGCSNTANGAITGKAGVGGIVGYTANGSITKSFNQGTITSNDGAVDLGNGKGSYSGGIVGYSGGSIGNCYNQGTVTTGTSWGSSNFVGGIAGFLASGQTVSYCYNAGAVSASSNIGGIVGLCNGTVSYCYQDGAITGLWADASAEIGYITSGTDVIDTCWILPSASITATAAGRVNGRYLRAYKNDKPNAFMYLPAVYNGSTYTTPDGGWGSIVNNDLNGFEIFAVNDSNQKSTVPDGYYLRTAKSLDWTTAAIPKIAKSNGTANAAGYARKSSTPIDVTYLFSADTKNDIYVSQTEISQTITDTVYNGDAQSVGLFAVPSGMASKTFYFRHGDAGDNASESRTNYEASGYDIITDVTIEVRGVKYVVGRKVYTTVWNITKRHVAMIDKSYFYGAKIVVDPAFETATDDKNTGLIAGHTVTSSTADSSNPGASWLYSAIPESGSKSNTFKFSNIVVNGDTTLTNNYEFDTEYTLTINEGDFGVQGTDDIAKNPWGSVNNPYLIRTQTQLDRLAQIVADGTSRNSVQTADFPYVKAQVQQNKQDFANCYFKLTNDVTMSNSSTPIGISASKPFKGTFDGGKVDGGSYTISNLKTYGYDYSGLFGYVQGGTIKNVNLDNLTVNNNGGKYHGGIAGELNGGTIENCNVNGWVWGNEYIGGIVGRVSGASTISNCTTSSGSRINFNGGSDTTRPRVGGIVGGMDGNGTFSVTISGCVNNAKINNANGGTYGFGGIVGYNSGQTVNISGCTNNAEINGKSETGGIIGYTDNSAIQNCTNNGVVKGADNVGGIVGKICAGTISACENKQEVTGGCVVGGIAGYVLKNDSIISGCVNSGDVYINAPGEPSDIPTVSGINKKGAYLGGIVGLLKGATIKNCYNNAQVSNVTTTDADGNSINVNNSDIIGGVVGYAWGGSVLYCASLEGKLIRGASAVGGIVGVSNGATIDYCYFGGKIEGWWNKTGAKLDFICGFQSGGTIRYSWKLPTAAYDGTLGSKTYTNKGYAIQIGNGFTLTPQVDSQDTKNKVWTDILTQNINGFKVVGNVAANNFFVTDNGKAVSDSNYKYVKPLTTEGFTGDIGSVTVRYSATTDSDIRAHAEAITLPTASTVYNGREQGFGYTTYPNTQSGAAANTPIVYTSLFVYLGQNHKENLPTYVDVYDVTVTITIDGQIVGKKLAAYTITPCEITITWTWTQYATANNGLSAEFEYNALEQGIESVDLAGYHDQFKVTGNVTGNNATIIPAGDYSRTYELIDARNYVIKNNNSNTITFRWKINAYNIKSHLENGEVWFGGSAGLIVGNQLTSKVNGNGVDYYLLQTAVKGTSGVQQVLVYAQNPSDTSQKLYTASHFVLYVKYNDGTVTKIDQGTDYDFGALNNDNGTVGAFKEDLVSNTNPVVDTNVTARGKVNFTGDITRYYTALYSDFGGDVTSAGWGSSTNNPYVIDRPEYLLRLSQIVNGGMAWNSVNNSEQCYAPQSTATAKNRSYAGAYFSVGADIKMDGYVSTDGITNFLPIGRIDTSLAREFPFSGTFDGKGNTIDYIYNTNDIRKDYIGLFGYTDGATITNFTLNCTSGEISGNDYVGFVVGYAKNSTIFDVKCEYGKKVNGNDYVGGVAGKAEGTTIKCSEGNRVYNGSVQGREYVGGIVGMWIVTKAEQIGGSTSGQASITPVGRSEVDGFRYVGGLVGYLDASGCDLLQFKPSFDNGTYKENNVTYNNLTVTGTEYVGALFGVLIGNGYHKEVGEKISTAIIIDAKNDNNGKAVPCVHNVNLNLVNYGTGDNIVAPQVVGGLIGYIESAGLIFNTSYNTSSIKFNFGDTTPSVLGGVVGILGKNATIETYEMKKPNGETLSGGFYPITNDVAFGSASKAFGSFVGGIAGFVSSQAGTAYETSTVGTTYIFGNAVHLVNAAEIYATGFAGGLFGAMGDVNSKLLSGIGEDTDLFAVLTTGVRKNVTPGTNLGVAPSVKSPFVKSAAGKMQNSALIVSVTDSYVGGLIGYVGDKVTLTLTNNERSATLEGLSIFSGKSDGTVVSVQGKEYVGGLVGYLTASAHRFEYIAVQAQIGKDGAQYVGGLVGYMANGTIEHCVATTNNQTTYNSDIDNFKGADFVGGLVGYVLRATINNSFTSGFNFASTSGTKGGIIGAGQQPNISSSWTIYIAQSGAKYANVSKNEYGKYIVLDDEIDKYNVDSITEAVFKFAGFGGATTTLDFRVTVPNANESRLKNKQLVFYDASGDDEVTKNTFSGYENGTITNNNDVLTFSLDAENGTSMQVYVKDIEFVNIPKCQATDDDSAKKATVQKSYRRPSNSDRYCVEVGTAEFDPSNQQVTHIAATVYFNGVTVGTATKDNSKIAGNFEDTFTPGSKDNPYTISTQAEWNDFAYSVYTGTTYAGKYFKLLTDDVVIDTGNNGKHEGTKSSNGSTVTYNFGTVQTIPAAGTNAPLTDASGNAIARNNIGYNFAGDISHDSDTNNFKGTFDGNGHYINIQYTSGGFYRVSVFPNAANATFRNLTIKGKIQAASQMTGANGIANSAAYDVAGFVGKPFGALEFYNCTNDADIIGLRNVAGIVGYNAGGQSITLEACVNTGDITSLQGTYTISGKSDKHNWFDSIDSAYGTSNIGFNSGTGGIIGAYTGNITIESCRNAGAIIGGHNVGGIIGLHDGTSSAKATLTIQNCANTGKITSNSGYWGEDEGGVEGAASEGIRQNIFGYVGGLVGVTGQYSILKMYASYNTGDILTLSNIIGGLVGSVGVLYQPKKFGRYDNNVKTGGRSLIAYCYNIGNITAGGTFPKITEAWDIGRENYGGTISGGFVGLAGDLQISQGYNTGNITNYGHISYEFSWQVRAGGFVGQSEPVSESGYTGYVLYDNLYNVGTIYVKPIDYSIVTGHTVKNNLRYGAAISGYCDVSGRSDRIKSSDCYSINNCVSSLCAVQNGTDYAYYKNGQNSWNPEVRDQWYQNEGVAGIGKTQVELLETGRVYNTYDALTAAMGENSKLRMTGSNFAFDQSITALTLNYGSVGNYTSIKEQIIGADASISDDDVSNLSTIKWKRFPDSWLYVYGCLPQLSMFALDTQNGLSMRSVGYGKNIYGDYNEEGKIAGATAQYPYIIKDGIDLMGMQALVDAGYSFENKYIEVANGTNNLEGIASKRIKLATYDNPDTAATNDASNTMYKADDGNGNYKVGKSYHLLLQGAIFNKAYNQGKNPTFVGSDYSNWAWSTYYYNGGYRDNEWTDSGSNPNKFYNYGGMRQLGIFKVQNFIPMGRGSSVFKGHFSGKQANGENTTIDDVRITTGKYGTTTEYGSEYGGLFAKVQDAYIGYISIGGSSKIWSFTKGNDISACGAIVGLALGDTVIDNCGIGDTTEEDTTEIGAYGISKTNEYVILDEGKIVGNIANGNFAKDTYAGGIVGLADPKQGNTYNAGITTTIRNCTISTSGRIESAKSNIGGIVGYIGGDVDANGKGNTVRIENGIVFRVTLQAFAGSETVAGSEDSHHIGGVIGYGSSYVPAYITGCEVGQKTTTSIDDQNNTVTEITNGSVNINGEYALGGIAGAMSNAVGGFIDSCSVGAGTTITRKAFYGSNKDNNKVSEDPKYGTAIGGLVGYTEAYETKQVTTTFSGENTFAGTINVSVATDNSDTKASNIGGIVGDMGDGANFASGSRVTVSGKITLGDTLAAQNIGGVAGRTSTATFIGTFDVHPTMTSPLAQNVGGFIGKNAGATYVLADISRATDTTLKGTTITIGSSDGNGNYSGSISAASNVGGIIGLNSAGSVFGIGSNNVDGTNYNKGTLHITIYATITGTGNNVGGIVGLNESDTTQKEYGVVSIVRGVIVQNGAISGASYVGGIVGYDNGVLETGGATADSNFSKNNQLLITELSITNKGNVTGSGDYVGGFIGRIDEPRNDQKATGDDVDIAGTFTNDGLVEGGNYVGGLIGYVGKGVTIGTKNDVHTEFKNSKNVVGHGNYIGGSIGLLLGTIKGASTSALVKFENIGNVDGKAYVGGSIGVIAGNVEYAQFINKSDNLTVNADTAVGGSVGYLGVPNTLKDKDEFKNISISVQNSHFEANGTLTVSGTSTGADTTETGGVGGAIGVIGSNVTTWSGNTYYARGNVTAGGINNVGGIIGLIKAANIAINNMLAYDTTVSGATNVGGIVGATTGANTQIVSAYAIEGEFTGNANVGGIIGLAQSNTVASTSYWVKGYKNSEIATYDVDNLKGLGFTTGTEQTGWFFLYANDANGAGDLGKINTKHSTAVVNNNAPSGAAEAYEVQADDAELKYWKRIADAYTASERANGEDDNAKNPLTSTIVKGFGAPQKGTLYATATATLVSSNGYYMYVATSGKVRPTIEYGNVDNTTLGYLISVNTVKNGGSATTADDTTEQSADTAGNVAVFYRKITKGEDLVYNGYKRNPIIGLDDVGSYNGVITLDNNGEATVSDYAEKYIYTATTITKDSNNNVSETVFDKPSDPGKYTPTIKIFYVDASGKARLVGGHLGLEWTIKTRELTATFSSESQRTYGDKQDEEGSVDKTITITNIAPNFGKTVPIQVTVSAGEESTTFTWKGSAATKTENGITLTFDALSAGEPLSEKDKSATSAEDLASDSNTYTLVCKIFFKEAKSYSIVVSDGSSQDNKVERYTIKDGTGTFTVNKATLTFQRVSGKPASSAFDGTAKTTEWEVTGFKYKDGDKELAAFLPQFNLQYKNASSASSVNLYSGDKLQDGGINGPTISIGVAAGSKVNFALSSAVRKGEYWISFGKSEAGNYKFEDYDSLKFNIVEVQITVSCSPSNGSKTYDKQAATITITFVASVPSNSGVTDFTGIDNYEQFIGKYFQITGEGSNAKFTVDKPNGTGKKTTVSWKITTGVNADTYTFTPELKSATKTEFEENCSWLLGDSTYQYKIKPRQLTLKATQTGTSPYTYTYDTYHHGLNEVSLDSQNGEKGLISGDTVKIAISGSVSKTLMFTSGGSQSAGISTINAGTYTANFALTGNGNYTLSTSSIKSMSWTINQYEVKIAKIGLSGASRPYDGTATTPTITITGVSGSNGTYTYNQDTFTIAYSITKDGTTLANGDKLKNAGRYEIKVGNGNGSIKAYRTNSSSTDTSKNYKFSDTNSIATYEITPLSISIEWNYPTPLAPLVYTGNNQMISIKSITLSDANNTTSRTLEMSSNSVDSGCGNDKLTFTLSGGGTDAGSDHTTTATLSSVKGNTDGIDSIPENYVLDDTATSGTFTIAKSKLKIAYASGTASRVYNGYTNVTNNSFTFSVSSTNGGANGSDDMFDKAMTYDNKNVGTGKDVKFTYSLKSGYSNYEYVETNKSQTVSGKGEITPLDIKVILNKLRNNKATRTFRTFINGKAYSYYGGQAGASGNDNSEVYRSGEGFTLSGVIPGDSVNVIAEYKEADDSRNGTGDSFDLSSYVNNVYKADDGTYKIESANKYFKKLVFTMSGDDAQNYTFNVYTGNKAYSDKSSTAGVTQTLTVYDSRSNVDGQKNVTTAPTIYIEITVKTYKVEYAHTAQSYANADNTYNTDWQRVVARDVPIGVTVTVSNGWMFADGKDHSDSEQAEKKQYTGYTTIRGSQNNVILGAKISGENGMELNYKMSNQPILTIGYFVAQGDEFEIGSAASLMIASYYWTIAQNKDNPDFNQELVAGSKWNTIVSNNDYMTKAFVKPSNAPSDVDMTKWDWDMYFAWFEQKYNVKIFLNETGISGEDGNWGYYEETETPSSISYTKFKLVRNFSGVLTESDIATLNAFFRVYNKDTKQYESVEWGYGGTYIANFLKSSVSSTLTALGSVFMSVENAATTCEFDGDGYVIEYLNIMGYGKSNVGFFDIVGSNSVVKNLHLRNVTINGNQGNVGGIAGSVLAAAEAASESSIANVSFHGTINVDVPTTNPTNGVVGGLVGNSARAIDGAIVLGTITANGAASVGGVVGVRTASISNVVSLMQVTAYSGTVGAFTATQDANVTNSFHMTNAVWLKGTGFVNVADESKSKSYIELMNGSISGYGTSNKYYYAGETLSTKGTYDVLADVKLTKLDAKGSENEANARESMRLKDLVYVYLLMYSLTEDTDSLTESTGSTESSNSFTVKVYKLSSSSWLVGNADGTSAKPVAIANKQNVSLLRQLPFATFTLKTNVTVSISNTFAGAFFGTVESAKNTDDVSLGYKITCNQAMFEAYAGGTPSWLTT